MNLFKHLSICLLLATTVCTVINAQTEGPRSSTVTVIKPDGKPDTLFRFREQFRIDSDKLIPSDRLNNFALEVDSILKADSITFVDIRGLASIDGPEALNNRLAKARAQAMDHWLRTKTDVSPGMITTSSIGEDWEMFLELVKNSPDLPARQQVINIINSNKTIAAKEAELRILNEGRSWDYMAKYIFPPMRVAEVSLGGYKKFRVIIDNPLPLPTVDVVETEIVEETPEEPSEILMAGVDEEWYKKFYIKTNAPAWLCLWINAAAELDIAPHFSVNLPIYYSGFNYFTTKLKFRTFSVVPEIRYWPKADNTGFFVNAHLGMSLYNYAKGGDWRYQDYKGHTPALGGGVGLGYRFYFCKNKRWTMEAAVGAGVYKLDYSIFQNFTDGLIVGRRQRTFFGIDQAALSFAYSFGLNRKGVSK